MLTEFSLSNFKSYKNSRLPLAPLTVLIGANASGKSNIIEGLRFLSWLAEGQKLSSIQYAVNSADSDQVMRGRINDLCHYGESNFTLGCRLDLAELNQLNITISVLDGEIKVTDEKINGLYEIVPTPKVLSISESADDVTVRYNTLPSDKSGFVLCQACSNQRAMFVQLDIQPHRNDLPFEEQQNIVQLRVTETVKEYQRVLQVMCNF